MIYSGAENYGEERRGWGFLAGGGVGSYFTPSNQLNS